MELVTQSEIAAIADTAAAKFHALVEERLSGIVARMQKAAGEAQNDAAAAKAEATTLRGQIDDLRATVEKVQGEARAAEDRRDALRLEVDELEPKVRTMRAHLDEHKQRVAAL